MNHTKFNQVIESQIESCKNLLIKKSQEYDFSEDRLRAFKCAAELLNSTPQQALLGYFTKHIVSLYDMIQSNNKFSIDVYNEKITDAINYLLLLKAIIIENSEVENEKNSN